MPQSGIHLFNRMATNLSSPLLTPIMNHPVPRPPNSISQTTPCWRSHTVNLHLHLSCNLCSNSPPTSSQSQFQNPQRSQSLFLNQSAPPSQHQPQSPLLCQNLPP